MRLQLKGHYGAKTLDRRMVVDDTESTPQDKKGDIMSRFVGVDLHKNMFVASFYKAEEDKHQVKGFRLSDKLASLMVIGVGICGVLAIIACSPVIEADEKYQSYAKATTLIFGAAALFLYPLVGHALNMSDQAFGVWAGLAVDNTAEAIDMGSIYSDTAGEFATLIMVLILASFIAR